MHHLLQSVPDYYLSQRSELIRPGEQDPKWVIRHAEHQRVLRLMRAEERADRNRERDARRGIVARLRMALNRG